MSRHNAQESETLQVALDELQATRQELTAMQSQADADQLRYQDLFEFAPDGYLVTTRHGKIEEVNAAASDLFNIAQRYMINKPLTTYIAQPDRKLFFQVIRELNDKDRTEATIRIIPRGSDELKIIHMTIAAVRYVGQPPHTLRWILRDVTEQYLMTEELRLSRQKLQDLSARVALVEEQERRRIATQIHDNIGQTLATVQLRLGMLRGDLAPEHAQVISEVRKELATATAQVRTLTFELSPAVLYELGLGKAIEWLIEQRSGLGVEFQFRDTTSSARYSREIEITVFQAVRELIANVVRHSQATRATIFMYQSSSTLVVEVRDNGIGFNGELERPTGLGLPGLRERMNHLRGELQISSSPGGGADIRLAVPLRPPPPRKTQMGDPVCNTASLSPTTTESFARGSNHSWRKKPTSR